MKNINHFLLIIGSIFFCFAVGEFLTRFFYDSISSYNLEMWRYAADLKEPYDDPNFPFHHYPNKIGQYYGVDIQTNSQGFRDREYAIKKTNDVKRIIFLGDSFTLGWGVPFDSIYSKKLEQKLNKHELNYEVINLGIGNYNNAMEVELFKRKGLQFDPDLVILMFYINDTEPTPNITTSLKYNLFKNSYLLAFILDRYVKLRASIGGQFDWKKYYGDLYDQNSISLKKNRTALKELAQVCREKNIDLFFVSIPELRELQQYPLGIATEFIRSVAEEERVPFLDLLPVLKNYESISLWVTPEDPHANTKANIIIADAILQKLEQENLIRF